MHASIHQLAFVSIPNGFVIAFSNIVEIFRQILLMQLQLPLHYGS